MSKKKIIGYLIAATLLTSSASVAYTTLKTNNLNNPTKISNHILLADANSGNQAAVVNPNNSPLVLYSSASNNSKIHSYLSVGEMLTINSSDNGYYNVTVHETGSTGYISSSNLQKITSGLNDNLSSLNEHGQIINVSSSVNLRSNATMNSQTLNKLENNTKIDILGKQGSWYKVSLGSQTGFIYQLYVGKVSTSSTSQTQTKPTNTTNTVTKPTNTTNTTNTTLTKPSTSTTVTKPNTSTTKPDTTVSKPENNINNQTSTSASGNNIITSAKNYAVPANQVAQMINGTYKGGGKQVFLTFDDGPSSTYTPQVLKILEQNNVHGTFFILGSSLQSKTNQNLLKEEFNDGNAIGNHSYSHNYSSLYPGNSININSFMNEFNKTESIMRSILGPNFNSKVLRMPGGENSRQYYHDKNLPAFKNTLAKNGITSIDWNVENGDATGKSYTPSQLLQNAINESKGKNHIVLLMHDIKGPTVQALPQIIQYYKSQGYTFDVISNSN